MSGVSIQWSRSRKEKIYIGKGRRGGQIKANIYASFLCLISYFREALLY